MKKRMGERNPDLQDKCHFHPILPRGRPGGAEFALCPSMEEEPLGEKSICAIAWVKPCPAASAEMLILLFKFGLKCHSSERPSLFTRPP